MLRAEFTSRADWVRVHEAAKARRDVEQLIASQHEGDERWFELGWCDVCEKASRFECDWLYSDKKMPNFRERLACGGCELNSRQRLMIRSTKENLAQLPDEAGRAHSVYLYEQVTPLYRAMKERVPEAGVVGSEYLGHEFKPGTYRDGIRHEDALQLSFASDVFDMVISNDVYEHVPNIQLALGEACRVLRPGGILLATIPFWYGQETQQRARLVDGVVEHLAKPEFHGNPLSEQGSLVFYVFGWDLLDMCRAAGFVDVKFCCTHSFFHGYLGEDLGLRLVAEKAPSPGAPKGARPSTHVKG
jgi:SAM-dependent methyltransferase